MAADRAIDAAERHQLELGLAAAGATAPSPAGEHSLAVDGDRASPVFQLEDPDYLCRQLVTYIGNKRALLHPIGRAVTAVKKRLNKAKLRAFDVFSGSGVVSRYLKAHASLLASNDIEDYATAIARCYLRDRSSVDFSALREAVADFNARAEQTSLPTGFIQELYSPHDENAISPADRVWTPAFSWFPSTTRASSAQRTCTRCCGDSARCKPSRPPTTPIAPAGT